MFEVELKDKGTILEFPDSMLGPDGSPLPEVSEIIRKQFYSEAPAPEPEQKQEPVGPLPAPQSEPAGPPSMLQEYGQVGPMVAEGVQGLVSGAKEGVRGIVSGAKDFLKGPESMGGPEAQPMMGGVPREALSETAQVFDVLQRGYAETAFPGLATVYERKTGQPFIPLDRLPDKQDEYARGERPSHTAGKEYGLSNALQIAQGLGQAAGFFTGAPMAAISLTVGGLSKILPLVVRLEKLSPIAQRLVHAQLEAAGISVGTVVSGIDRIIKGGVDQALEELKGGAGMGEKFGLVYAAFPQARLARMVAGIIALRGKELFNTDVPLSILSYQVGMDILFLGKNRGPKAIDELEQKLIGSGTRLATPEETGKIDLRTSQEKQRAIEMGIEPPPYTGTLETGMRWTSTEEVKKFFENNGQSGDPEEPWVTPEKRIPPPNKGGGGAAADPDTLFRGVGKRSSDLRKAQQKTLDDAILKIAGVKIEPTKALTAPVATVEAISPEKASEVPPTPEVRAETPPAQTRVTIPDFVALAKERGTNSTAEAIRFGKRATPEVVAELKRQHEEVQKEAEAAKVAKDLQKGSYLGTRSQDLRNAIERSEGKVTDEGDYVPEKPPQAPEAKELVAPIIPDAPRPLHKVYGPKWEERPDAEALKKEFNKARSARGKALKEYKKYVEESNKRHRSKVDILAEERAKQAAEDAKDSERMGKEHRKHRDVGAIVDEDLRAKLTTYADLVREAEGGRRIKHEVSGQGGTEDVTGLETGYPGWFQNQGWSGKKVETAIRKGLEGKKLGPDQELMWKRALEAATEEVENERRDWIRQQAEEEGIEPETLRSTAKEYEASVEEVVAEEEGIPVQDIRTAVTEDEFWAGVEDNLGKKKPVVEVEEPFVRPSAEELGRMSIGDLEVLADSASRAGDLEFVKEVTDKILDRDRQTVAGTPVFGESPKQTQGSDLFGAEEGSTEGESTLFEKGKGKGKIEWTPSDWMSSPIEEMSEGQLREVLDKTPNSKEGLAKEDWEFWSKRRKSAQERLAAIEAGKGAPPRGADSGGYASSGSFGTPPGPEARAGSPEINVLPLDLPELVELARGLMEGRYPDVVKKIRGRMTVGRFFERGSGEMKILASLFKNEEQARKTMAHEIGHLNDWLPNKFRNKGNILGRIASLEGYARGILHPEWSKGPLTKEERQFIREIAKNLASKDNPEQWIDEEITRTMPISPEDVLAIWNDMNFDRILNKQMYDYVASLSAAEKKSIIKEAMRGQVREDVRQFAKTVTEKTGKKIPIPGTGTPEQIRAKFEQLIREEIERRHIFYKTDIMEELKTFTKMWKPFDETANRKYTQYRFSASELYADSWSAMLTDPNFLRANAPRYWAAFFDFLDAKPEVKRQWDSLQNDIRLGTSDEKLVQRIIDGFRQKEKEFVEGIKMRASDLHTQDAWFTSFLDRYFAIQKRVRKVDGGNVPVDLNPIYSISKLRYTGAQKEAYLSDLKQHVFGPMEKQGITVEQVGVVGFLQNVIQYRKNIASSYGTTESRALGIIAKMPHETRIQIERLLDDFYRIRKENVVKGLLASNIYGEKLRKVIQDSDQYLTFDIVGHLETNYGREATARIFPRVGTLRPAGNPISATMTKDMLLMRMVNKNNAAKNTIKFMSEYYSGETKEPDTHFENGKRVLSESRDHKFGLVVYMENGKMVGKYLPRIIAESLNENPAEANLVVSGIRVVSDLLRGTLAPFRMLFTEANPGFWPFNMIRDYRRLAIALPKATLTNMASHYVEAIKPAFKSAWGNNDPLVNHMLREGMLISVEDYRGEYKADLQNVRLLRRYHVEPKLWDNKIARPFQHFWYYYSGIARATERMPKIAGYTYLKKAYPEMPNAVIGEIVRTRAGSPDFLRQGTLSGLYNNIFMFSNAQKEGIRGDLAAFGENKAEFAWKTFKYSVLPKLAMFGLSLGVADDLLKKNLGEDSYFGSIKFIYDNATEYDKTNYIVIPLGVTKQKRAVYLRLPQDETGRLIGAVVWKILGKERANVLSNLGAYMSGQAPTLNPIFGLLMATQEYLAGNNIHDSFRQTDVISKLSQDARPTDPSHARREFLQWVWNQAGGGIAYRFLGEESHAIKTELEDILGYPIISNIFGRFIRVTDKGEREDIRKELKVMRSQNADRIISAREALDRLISSGSTVDISSEDIMSMAAEPASVNNHTKRILAEKFGDVYIQMLDEANSVEERAFILYRMFSKKPPK